MTISMETRSDLFIADTSGLVSLINSGDRNHARAVAAAGRLRSTDVTILLGSDVFSETINLLGRKFGHVMAADAATLFLHEDSRFLFVETTLEQTREAVAYFRKQKQSVSYTDCMVITLASEHRTPNIFGFDKDFEAAGCKPLQPAEDSQEAA